MRRARLTPGLLLALLLAAFPSAAAEGPAAEARAAIAALDGARAALAAAEGRDDRVAALAETIRAYENGLAALRAAIRRTAMAQRTMEGALEAERGDLSALLGALAVMGRRPEAGILLHPDGPLATARAGMLMQAAVPALNAEASEISARLEALASLREAARQAETRLAAGLGEVQTARAELAAAVSARETPPPRFGSGSARLARIAANSGSIAALTRKLDALPSAAPEAAPRGAGALPLPVRGRLLRNFGEPDAAGVRRPGWIVATKARALVTAPLSASVRFRGTLAPWGGILVLEPRKDMLITLAGLGEVLAEPGTVVHAGDPLALMPEADTPGDSGAGPGLDETLYIEMRESGEAVDPARWFAQE